MEAMSECAAEVIRGVTADSNCYAYCSWTEFRSWACEKKKCFLLKDGLKDPNSFRGDIIDFHHQNMLCGVLQWNYKHQMISLLTLASCNIDQDHPDFDSKTLLATQNIMGFALTTDSYNAG